MPSDFHEVRFPLDVSLRGSAGPSRLTEVVTLASGREHRNSRWADSRRRYDAGFGIRTLDALHAVVSFFEERRGRLYGFRYRDRVDFRSGPPGRAIGPGDQPLGLGDGTRTAFPLAKTYG
ncbi:TIGR02217 family protein, partial [Methylobacterium trifolii]